MVWLVGKVQSGKSSIVRTLTGSSEAEIGSGFAACTTTSRVFDFPARLHHSFLDTRGVGEVGYDPAEDIAFCERARHLVIAVVKAGDMAQGPVLDVLASVRKASSRLALVVAQTCLHELYAPPVVTAPAHLCLRFAASIGARDALERALAHQRGLFKSLSGRAPTFVPIDFTLPGDGLDPADYGHEALIAALIDAAPEALSQGLARLPRDGQGSASIERYVWGFAIAAGASDAVPLAASQWFRWCRLRCCTRWRGSSIRSGTRRA